MNKRLIGDIADFVFMESPKVVLSLKKTERGTHVKLVTVHRGGKTFKRKQRVGRKEEDKEIIKIPTREEFYSQEYWHDPKRGQHPASGSGRLPTKDVAQIEIKNIGGEPAIRIYNPWTKEEIYYYDLDQMDEAKERFKNLYDETFNVKKSSLHPDNLQGIDDLNESGIVGLVGGIHEAETYICRFKDGSQAIHKTMQAGDIAGEIGAYETSKIIGWDVVPETIQCDYGKGKGSTQKWIPNNSEPYDGFDDNATLIEEKHLNDLSKIFILDCINSNFDRHSGNIIIDKNDHVWAIDNEMWGKKNNAELHIESLEQYAKSGMGSPMPMIRVIENSIGDDIKLWQKFKDNVDLNISIALKHENEIMEYWNKQISPDVKAGGFIPSKEAVNYIKQNLEYLENYRGKND